MTFYYGKNLDEIIKNFTNDNYNYNIKYLDDSETTYYCTNEERKKELEFKMLEQAIKRDFIMYEPIETTLSLRFLSLITGSIACAFTFNSQLILLFCINFLLLIYNINKYIEGKNKLNELKKYRLYFEICEELEKEENKGITDILEFDKIYQKPILNINTIDEFSLKDVKKINDEIIKRKILKAK